MLWAYDGFADLSFASGEVKDPQRNLPRAIIFGTLAIIAIYVSANLAYLYMNPIEKVQSSRLVAADTMSSLFGQAGAAFISVVVMISTFGSLMGSMLASPRIFFAMADDRLFFKPIAAVHPRFHTPYVAILFACVLGIAMVMTQTFEQLTDTFVLAMWPFYGLSVAAIYRLRKITAASQPSLQGRRLPDRPGNLRRRGDLSGHQRVDHRSRVDVDHVWRRAGGTAGVLRALQESSTETERRTKNEELRTKNGTKNRERRNGTEQSLFDRAVGMTR